MDFFSKTSGRIGKKYLLLYLSLPFYFRYALQFSNINTGNNWSKMERQVLPCQRLTNSENSISGRLMEGCELFNEPGQEKEHATSMPHYNHFMLCSEIYKHSLSECALKRWYLSSECWQMVFSSPCKVFVPKPRIFNVTGDICRHYFVIECWEWNSKILCLRQEHELMLTSNYHSTTGLEDNFRGYAKEKSGTKEINISILICLYWIRCLHWPH